jgi:hypothetical protein
MASSSIDINPLCLSPTLIRNDEIGNAVKPYETDHYELKSIVLQSPDATQPPITIAGTLTFLFYDKKSNIKDHPLIFALLDNLSNKAHLEETLIPDFFILLF